MKIVVIVKAEPEKSRHRTLTIDGARRTCTTLPGNMTAVGAPAEGLYMLTIDTKARHLNAYVHKRRCYVSFGRRAGFYACFLPRRMQGKRARVEFVSLV